MKHRSLKERYDAFCADAENLLQESGLADDGDVPRITGRAFYDICLNLAKIHFPEDKELGGTGPRGILWSMHAPVEGRGKDADIVGARAIAQTLRHIIQHRPRVQKASRATGKSETAGSKCPFFEPRREYKVQKNLVFVLMPFREPWSDRLWKEHIREYLRSPQLKAVVDVRRADEMFGQAVMEDVWQGIVTAQLVLAECTGRNPNVLYELGLAHAIGKRTALLSQTEDDILFDLRRFRFCIYEDNSSGYPKLRHFLQETIREVIAE